MWQLKWSVSWMFDSAPHSPLSYQIRPFPFTLGGKRWKWIKKRISLAIPLRGALTFFLFWREFMWKKQLITIHNTISKKKGAYRRSSRVVRASDCQCQSRNSPGRVLSQHPPTQWKLGDRWSNVDESAVRKKKLYHIKKERCIQKIVAKTKMEKKRTDPERI
jgi:hypothetical protein